MSEFDLFRISVSGTAGRTVVLGNGFGTTQAVWQRVLPWLEERFRVVRFDWPVSAAHFDYTRYSSLAAFAADLLRIIDHTSAAPCLFIGHSMSGMIGMLAGKIRPEAFERMVMINPSPRYIDDACYRGGFSDAEVNALLGAISDNYLAWVRGFAPVVVGGAPDRPEVDEFARGLLAMRPDVTFSLALILFRSDLRQEVRGFAVPTDIVQSLSDPAVPVEVAHYLRDAWPDSRVHPLDADGHLPHLTHAPQVVDTLERIFSGINAG